MMKNTNTPAIRFKGFTDAWEQRKLGEIMSVGSVKRVHQEDWQQTGIRFLRARDIVAELKREEVEDKLYISQDQYDEYTQISGKVSQDDLLVTGVGTIGVPYLVRNNVPLYFKDGNIIWFKNSNSIDGKFFFYSFLGKTIQYYISSSSGTGTVGTYTIESGNNTPIFLPAKKEQEVIGLFFDEIDTLITLHQRKLDQLKTIKKSLLEKMFPKSGKSVPDIRFKGFTDAWEQRKLGEIADIYDGVHQTPIYTDSGIMFLSVENIGTLKSNKYISEEAFNRDYKVYPQKGDILMTRIGDVGTPNVVETSEKVAFYVSLALLKPSNVDSYFLCNSILSPFFQSGLKERTLITAIPQKINKDEIGKVRLFLPPSNDEQMQIGNFFSQLDTLITLHQRKLDLLKNIKKSLLQKMFV